MLGAPDLPHSALAQLLDQLVASQLVSAGDALAHVTQRHRRQHGDDGADVVRVIEQDRIGHARRCDATQRRHPRGQRIHRCRYQTCHAHFQRRRWHHHGVHEDQDAVPGHLTFIRERGHPLVEEGDGQRVEHEQPESEVEDARAICSRPRSHVNNARGKGRDHDAGDQIARPRKGIRHAERAHDVFHEKADAPCARAHGTEERETLYGFLKQTVWQIASPAG